MPDKATISHRGEKYEIGRGRRFYGIWAVGAPYDAPIDRWPENHDGWQQAWTRFSTIEVPGTITAVTPERRGLRLGALRRRAETADGGRAGTRSRGGALLAGEGLLVLGVVLGLAGLFPQYEGGQSLLSQWDQVVPHLCYVIGWMLTAGFVALSVARPSNAVRLGSLFGLGLSAVTFGLFVADLGEVVSGGVSLGTGLVVSLLGWLACTAGSALAFWASGAQPAQYGQPGAQARSSRPVRPGLAHAGPLGLLVLAGIGTAASFAPSWDSYTLVATATGSSQTVTAGNAFSEPAMVIAGNVIVMVMVIAVATLAALWRPPRHGALLLAGAIVPVAAQAVSALIQAGQAATPAMFGISSAQAAAAGLTISTGLTPIFWVYFVFVISLMVSCAWLFTEPDRPAMAGFPGSPWLPAGADQGPRDAASPLTTDDEDSDVSEESDDPDDADDTDSDGADSDTGTEGDGQSAYVR